MQFFYKRVLSSGELPASVALLLQYKRVDYSVFSVIV
jgi:hypothetical protein